MPSRASQLFDQLVRGADPSGVLKQVVVAKKAESEFLEFKGAGKINDQQIKEYWSRALSGFGNTEGGVLLWGVRAARVSSAGESRGIDAAADFDLAPKPGQLAQLLKDVMLEAVSEPLPGVEIEIVLDGSNGGFVVCLVPEGNHKPYRAQLDSSKQYYQRISDNFVVIPHAILRSLFYPRTQPMLKMTMEFLNSAQISADGPFEDHQSNYHFQALVHNRGTASGRDVFIIASTNCPSIWDRTDAFVSQDQQNHRCRRTFTSLRSIHPGEITPSFKCTITGPAHLHRESVSPNMLQFEVEVYATDAEPIINSFSFNSEDLKRPCQLPEES